MKFFIVDFMKIQYFYEDSFIIKIAVYCIRTIIENSLLTVRK